MSKQKGQALLIIVLVMAVALTIGLAVISRSVTDIKISKQEEDSARVFSVAEAGIEEALMVGIGYSGTIDQIGVNVVQIGQGGGGEFVFPYDIQAESTQTLWLVEHNPDGTLKTAEHYSGNSITLYWGTPGLSTADPALEAILIYKDGANVKVARYALDYTCKTNPSCPSSFDEDSSDMSLLDPPEQMGGKSFRFKKTINFSSLSMDYPYALRLKFFYNEEEQNLGVKAEGSVLLPSQGNCYESTATDSVTNITRKIRQCRFFQAPPGIFDYALYSGGDLSK